MIDETKIRAFKDMSRGDIIFLNATSINSEGKRVAFASKEEELFGTYCTIPELLGLLPEQAQVLMDDLWTCGIRPTEGKGSAGAMAATEKHLKDMRAIVSNKLKVPL